MKLRFRDVLDRFLLYMPTIGMALLALGTYWMSRTTLPVKEPVPATAQSHEPNYFMEGFTLKSFDATGRLRSELKGAKARHYADNAWTEIDEVRFRSSDESGRVTTASADRGLSNEDGSEVQLIGNAIVVREALSGTATSAQASIVGNVQPDANRVATPRMEYRGEFLHAFAATEKIKSHKPVELLRGTDRFTADNMDFDNVAQTLVLQGRVRATLTPTLDNP